MVKRGENMKIVKTTSENAKTEITVQKGEYKHQQKRYNQFIETNGLTVSPESVKAYIDSLTEMSASTQRKAKTALKQALEFTTVDPSGATLDRARV